MGDHAYVYARFGQELPRLLINVHLDTVPANTGYGRRRRTRWSAAKTGSTAWAPPT